MKLFLYFSMLLVEGYGIQDVMGKPGVDGKNTKTNHIVEVKPCDISNLIIMHLL